MNPSPMLALRVYVCAMSGRGRQPAQVQVSSFQLQNQSPGASEKVNRGCQRSWTVPSGDGGCFFSR